MADKLTAAVTIDSRNETVYDDPGSGTKLSRVIIERSYEGDLNGTSVANLLLAQGEGGGGYMASERFSGSIGGRTGSAVFHHGRVTGGGKTLVAFGEIVPGSGSGDLESLTGSLEFEFSPNGNTVTLTL